MTYTITNNNQFGSLEIAFDGKPSEAIREALKALKFRWHGVKKVWYGYGKEAEIRAALNGEPVEKKDAPKAPTFDKDMLRREFAKAWKDPRMIDYCTGKVAAYAELPGGELITVDKQSIETRFCFGESGYDFDDAVKAAQHARTSQEYFKAENMEHFNRCINDLLEALNGISNYKLVIYSASYTGQTEDCRLRGIGFEKLPDLIDACGGSCYLYDLPGKELTVRGRECRVATPAEMDLIIDAYKRAAAAHEKKVDAYLKRYGTSKVHSWTYWRDA